MEGDKGLLTVTEQGTLEKMGSLEVDKHHPSPTGTGCDHPHLLSFQQSSSLWEEIWAQEAGYRSKHENAAGTSALKTLKQLRMRRAVTEFRLEVLREQSTADIDPHGVLRSAGTRVCSLGNDLMGQMRKGCLEASLIILLYPRSPVQCIHTFVLSFAGVMDGPLQEDPTDRFC